MNNFFYYYFINALRVLLIKLCQFCAIEKTKKRKQNNSTAFALFGWEICFNRQKTCRNSGRNLIYRLKLKQLNDKTTTA